MNLKSLLIDLVGLAGFAVLVSGLFLQFGLAVALIAAGALMVIYAIWAGN